VVTFQGKRRPISKKCRANQWPFCAGRTADLTGRRNSADDRFGCQSIFVDCSSVKVLGSETLSKLLLLQRQMKRKGARLVLSGLRTEVRDVLSWTKLDRVFAIQ